MCSTVFALESQWWKRCGPCPLLIYSLATSASKDVCRYFLSKLWVVKITLPNSNMHVCMLSHFSCVWLFGILWTIVHQSPLPMGFSRQKYWSGLPCPLPWDLPHPGIKPESLMSPALAGGFLPLVPPGRLQSMGSLGVGHDWVTSLSLFTFMHWRRKWQPTPVFFPRESQGQGSLVGCRLWGRIEWDTTEVT